MFMFRGDSEEQHEADRRRVIEEMVAARLAAQHARMMQVFGMPEDFFSRPQPAEPAQQESPMRVVTPRRALPPPAPRDGPLASGPLRSDAAAGYRRSLPPPEES